MDQSRGDKTEPLVAKQDQFKPIQIEPPSDGYGRRAAFAVHH
jgi:hypothetical protein